MSVNSNKINLKQKDILGEFMQQHSNLAKNIVTNTSEGKATSKRLWKQLTIQLNNAGPPTKEEKSWRKVWTDQKHKVKKNLSFNKKSLRQTGGGPYNILQLSAFEESVVAAAGIETSVEGLIVPTYGAKNVNPTTSETFENYENYNTINSPSVCETYSISEDDTLETPGIASISSLPIARNTQIPKAKAKPKKNSESERITLLKKNCERQEKFECAFLGKMDDLISVFKERSETEKAQFELSKQTAAQTIKYQKDKLNAKLLKIKALQVANDINRMETDK